MSHPLLRVNSTCYSLLNWPISVLKKVLFADVVYTVISGRLPARPITRTGRLLHTAKKKVNRLPALVDNPHVMLFNFLVAKT